MEIKPEIDQVIIFRRQGMTWEEIAQRLGCKASQVKRICLSKSYKKRSEEWIIDSREAMDTAFGHYSQIAAKNALILLENALEMCESESPRLRVEGLKLAYQMVKDSRLLNIDKRVLVIEEKLESIEES
jgi:hypothetical protein